jgi:hypothetical protein
MCRFILGIFLLTIPAGIFAAGADEPSGNPQEKKKPISKVRDDAAIEQERLASQYRGFELAVLHLAQRLERSSKPEDRQRARVLNEAIKKSSEVGITHKFDTLIGLLRSTKPVSITELTEAMTQSKMLADDIQTILDILLSDNQDAQRRAERERIEKLLRELEKIIREQSQVRALTETGKTHKDSLGAAQSKVTKSTEKLGNAMGKPSDGKQGGQGQQGQEGQPNGKKPPQQQNSNQNQSQQTPGRKQVQEAIESQKKAETEIDKDKKAEASNHQDKALQKLEEVRKKLEELLRQLREEELQRLLAALEARCRRMLEIQLEVYEATLRVEKAISQNPDRVASRSEEQRSLKLSDREMEIVREAKKGLELLEAEGSGVAFPEVFSQVRDDATHVARRLGKADVGQVTQAIEQDIIASLKEMIEALKRAGGGGGGGGGGKAGNKALIDLLAELKMIRSLQIRVNQRTLTYGRQYTGEQAADPDIQKELANLAQRQQKVFEITNDIARGKNR